MTSAKSMFSSFCWHTPISSHDFSLFVCLRSFLVFGCVFCSSTLSPTIHPNYYYPISILQPRSCRLSFRLPLLFAPCCFMQLRLVMLHCTPIRFIGSRSFIGMKPRLVIFEADTSFMGIVEGERESHRCFESWGLWGKLDGVKNTNKYPLDPGRLLRSFRNLCYVWYIMYNVYYRLSVFIQVFKSTLFAAYINNAISNVLHKINTVSQN